LLKNGLSNWDRRSGMNAGCCGKASDYKEEKLENNILKNWDN
jgi:hypothetical protein